MADPPINDIHQILPADPDPHQLVDLGYDYTLCIISLPDTEVRMSSNSSGVRTLSPLRSYRLNVHFSLSSSDPSNRMERLITKS